MCVDFCLLPILGVPFDIRTTYWTALRPEWVLSALPSEPGVIEIGSLEIDLAGTYGNLR